jgi:hypothetical protein
VNVKNRRLWVDKHGTDGRSLNRLLCLCLAAAAGISAAEGSASLPFLVHGHVTFIQAGSNPRKDYYRFTARNGSGAWSISAAQEPRVMFEDILAVGSSNGVFITFDMSGAAADLRAKGADVPNTSQAIVSRDPVPNSSFAIPLGPVWLTYLSAAYLADADRRKVSPPTALNIAGGCTLPPAVEYYQKADWHVKEDSGLPEWFISMDEEGFRKGPISGNLVRLDKYSPPFDRGFTNILFQVKRYSSFQGHNFPAEAELEVYWIKNGKRERLHQFIITATDFEAPGSAPLPEATTRGVAIVSDWTLKTKRGPILLEYMATNRFLNANELTNLGSFQAAVRESLERIPPTLALQPAVSRPLVLAAFVLVSLAAGIALFALRQKPTKKT